MQKSEDQIIDYYFQQKVAGMSYKAIQQSLMDNNLGVEYTGFIVRQVKRKEVVFNKQQLDKKLARVSLFSGLPIFATSLFLLFYYYPSSLFEHSLTAFYSLTLFGFLLISIGHWRLSKGN